MPESMPANLSVTNMQDLQRQLNFLFQDVYAKIDSALGLRGGNKTNDGSTSDTSDTSVAWTAFTPTITAASGAFTSVTAGGYYQKTGKTVHFRLVISIPINGTAAVGIVSTLPVQGIVNERWMGIGGDPNMTGQACVVFGTDTFMEILFYDGTYPGSDGGVIRVSGTYEAA